MTSNAISGSSGIFALGSNAVAEWTKVDFDGKGKMIDVSSIENANFEQFIAGKRGGSITVECLFVPGDTNGQFVLMNAWLNGTLLTSGTLPKLSRSSGGPNLSGDAYVESFKWTVQDNDKQGATFSLKFTGNISYSAT
jgi:hypothetical protein